MPANPVSVGHYENFPVASRLVPARLRPAVVALYRFARGADDLADEGDATPAQRLAALSAYDAALDEIGRGGTPEAPPFPALAQAVRAHGLPLQPMHDLVAAFRQDVTVGRYATYDDLLAYCRRSANPVGRLLLVAERDVLDVELMAGVDQRVVRVPALPEYLFDTRGFQAVGDVLRASQAGGVFVTRNRRRARRGRHRPCVCGHTASD